MTTIQVRIDEKSKKAAKIILNKLGIDMSAAIKVYLRQIAIRKQIPFSLISENGLTPIQETSILKISNEATLGKNVTTVMTTKEAVDYLNALS
jgi:DNA-damage-inducible protein J